MSDIKQKMIIKAIHEDWFNMIDEQIFIVWNRLEQDDPTKIELMKVRNALYKAKTINRVSQDWPQGEWIYEMTKETVKNEDQGKAEAR